MVDVLTCELPVVEHFGGELAKFLFGGFVLHAELFDLNLLREELVEEQFGIEGRIVPGYISPTCTHARARRRRRYNIYIIIYIIIYA